MKPATRSIKRCGTEQPDVVGRTLHAGALHVEFDNGQLRYLKVGGVEVLRAVAFLVRDENWGTYTPVISDLMIDQRNDGFSVSFHAACSRPGQEIAYDARIEASTDGTLRFTGTATPKTDFLTARTGFVVLHPLKGVAGAPLTVEHVDGRIVAASFPPLVDPVQPFLNLRALTHEVQPGVKACVRMEGDTFEMEDHRNWTDASFKTYVRPLSRPWPYTLPAGEAVTQSISVTLSGVPRGGSAARAKPGIEVRLGAPSAQRLPPLGLGLPAEEIAPTLDRLDLFKLAAPNLLQCHFDPRRGHGLAELEGYRRLAEASGAAVVLEAVVQSVDAIAVELASLAAVVRRARLKLAAIAVCPVGDLKSVLPGGPRPPAPDLAALFAATRAAFPGVKVGGGMFSFFTELNRKRPPAASLDFAMNTTCPIVHAADDRSVMETLEALPYQIRTARAFLGSTPHRIGPSAIGCRDNPHGATFTPNPNNQRVCLARNDPRTRALFGAAWTLGYIATLARTGIECLTMGAPTGPLGFIYRKTDDAQPWFDSLGQPAVYPAFHVMSGVSRGARAQLVDLDCSDPATVQGLAYRNGAGTVLWLANLSAQAQRVSIGGAGARAGGMIGTLLDEASFEIATTDPQTFQRTHRPFAPELTLEAYAVAILALGAA
jgi:D-apionolactonase